MSKQRDTELSGVPVETGSIDAPAPVRWVPASSTNPPSSEARSALPRQSSWCAGVGLTPGAVGFRYTQTLDWAWSSDESRLVVCIACTDEGLLGRLLVGLAARSKFCVAGALIGNPRELLALIRSRQPEILLVDESLFDADCVDPANLDGVGPGVRIVLLGEAVAAGKVPEMLRAGVVGYLARDVSPALCAKALKAVGQGELWLPRAVLTSALLQLAGAASNTAGHLDATARPRSFDGLTGRQREVLALVQRGLSNKEIAGELKLSVETVKKHLARLIGKTGTYTRRRLRLR